MIPHLERPSLRPGLAVEADGDPHALLLYDRYRLVGEVLRLTPLELQVIRCFQGQATLIEIQATIQQEIAGQLIPLEWFARLADKLDRLCFLHGPRFEAKLNRAVRAPSCIGCYSEDPAILATQLQQLFIGRGGPGLPAPEPRSDSLLGALVPHMDFARGGVCYGWGFKEIVEHSEAELFVILATSHYSRHRFTLTRQDFQTPLGIVATDQPYIDRLVAHYGDGLFEDRLAHVPEHSIELEVVLLHWLRRTRPFRIVPLLVGSFHDCVVGGELPRDCNMIRRMIAALREATAQTRDKVCYLISGDLAHIGPKFGDPHRLTEVQLRHSRAQDYALLHCLGSGDAAGYFRVVAREQDERRICGFPPTALFLDVAHPATARTLHYEQYLERTHHESVSFASVGFYRNAGG